MIAKLVYLITKFHGFNKIIDYLVEFILRLLLPNKKAWNSYLNQYAHSFKSFDASQKFYNDPKRFLKNMAIVLRSATETEKGVVLVAYNYAFPTLVNLFDLDALTEKYHIVLEPSTARYCMPDILMFKGTESDIYVQTGEIRDEVFLKRFAKNLLPIPIAANWWIDSRIFKPAVNQEKDIDVIMVSSWLKLKRHYLLFDALQKIKRQGRKLKCVLVGYPIDMTIEDIILLAKKYDVLDQIELHEWLSQEDIAGLYQRAKLNLLLSTREGFNRSVIEGFHANVPCLLREGFNFGHKYDYINDETGGYFTDDKLYLNIITALDNVDNFKPQEWIIRNEMTAQNAAKIIEKCIYGTSDNNIAVKISGLDGMEYWDESDETKFERDYDTILAMSNKG